jgi:FeS assembly SUF system protein
MVNFLSKFLSKKTDDVVETVSKAEPIQETAPAPVVAETAVAEAVAASAAGVDAPERPMHHVDPHSGIPIDLGELEEFVSIVGETLLPGVEKADEDAVIDAMRTVYDPEIPVNIYDLGLIYTIDHADNGDINVEMSLTAPGCPVAGEMPGMVSDAVALVEGVGVVTTKIVWEPAWTMDRMSEDAKLALGMF